MKSRIKTGRLKRMRQRLLSSADPRQIRRIVKRRQIGKTFDGFQYRIINFHRAGKFFAAVNHPMADRFNLADIFDGSCPGISQNLQNHRHGLLVIVRFNLSLQRLFARRITQSRLTLPDSLDHSLGRNANLRHFKQLKLDG